MCVIVEIVHGSALTQYVVWIFFFMQQERAERERDLDYQPRKVSGWLLCSSLPEGGLLVTDRRGVIVGDEHSVCVRRKGRWEKPRCRPSREKWDESLTSGLLTCCCANVAAKSLLTCVLCATGEAKERGRRSDGPEKSERAQSCWANCGLNRPAWAFFVPVSSAFCCHSFF